MADAETRSRLSGVKLGALVVEQGAVPTGEPVPFGSGAALVAGVAAWVLADGDASGALGPALAWAAHRSLTEVNLIGDDGIAVAARRARLFDPAPFVWRVDDRALHPAEPAPVADPPAPPDVPHLAHQLSAAGLDVNVEHGNLLGEYRGLEVARVVVTDGEPARAAGEREFRLEVGVGKYDRELTGMLHGDLPTADALARVVEIVKQHRRADGVEHPLRAMAPERWLRHRLQVEPSLAGCDEVVPVPSPFARHNLLERATAAAAGITTDGRDVVIVTSVGVDLDLVPTAADSRLHLAPDDGLVVVVPARDRHPLTLALAGRVAGGCAVVTVEGEWRSGH